MRSARWRSKTLAEREDSEYRAQRQRMRAEGKVEEARKTKKQKRGMPRVSRWTKGKKC